MANGQSSLASGFSRRGGDARTGVVYGIAVHTTGSGVVDASAKKGRDPLEYTVHEVYEIPDNYCARSERATSPIPPANSTNIRRVLNRLVG